MIHSEPTGRAAAISQGLLARYVAPLFPESAFTPQPDTHPSSPATTPEAHQRAVKPSPEIFKTSNTPDVAADPSMVLFAQNAARQVKAWSKVRARVSKAAQHRAQKSEAKAQKKAEAQPDPLPLTDLLDREAVTPRRGKGAGKDTFWRYAVTVYRLAVEQYRALSCRVLPHQITIFTSAELLAKLFRVNLSTIYRWNKLLEKLGYLQARAHFGSSAEVRAAADERKSRAKAARQAEQVDAGELGAATPPQDDQGTDQDRDTVKRKGKDTVVDGMVYAVRLRPGHRARLHIEDLQHQYRDIDADRAAGRTAHALIKQMEAEETEAGTSPANLKMHGSINPREAEWFSILRIWAVRDFFLENSLENDPCILADIELRSVEDVIEAVTLIREVHVTKRNPLIGFLADAMTRVFHDPTYHRAYCKLLWQAWRDETEGRAGLQVLMAQLSRIHADRKEWGGLRKPGALLMTRMQTA